MINKNCLSYWYPLIKGYIPTPETIIIKADCELIKILDGEKPECWDELKKDIKNAGDKVGWPCFLRTGQGSNKHDWDKSCYLKDSLDIGRHLSNLIEWSCLVDIFGLPHDIWVVREILPTKPAFTAFHNMPICREFRCFVKDAEIQCIHPYWPKDILMKQGWYRYEPPPQWEEKYEKLILLKSSEKEEIEILASSVGKIVGEEWSIDILDTEKGWYVTDMAIAKNSWHWPLCPNNKHEKL